MQHYNSQLQIGSLLLLLSLLWTVGAQMLTAALGCSCLVLPHPLALWCCRWVQVVVV
jgi:hypothetical protein